ncbi:hypothetical protein J2Y48_004779 [Mycoplana sp. BE70]|uniref:nutrient deprivation-induced protein n=1 Tax=Mycoplana sp. BE70 TaxID=2817775 RepID=UPI00285704BD|nr:nutrient deprivation-induced protein [Mycoplana sp. BE70]MDR6759463.1 hypothetical protein [Mycoplana sp. BE70]
MVLQGGSSVPTGGLPTSPAESESGVEPRQQQPSQSGAGDLARSLKDDLQDLGQVAKEQTQQVKEAASKIAADERNFAATKVSGIATAISKIGAEMEQSDQPEVGRYAKRIGSSLQNFAGEIKDRDLREVANMAEDFGFVTSRFLMASPPRRTGKSAPFVGCRRIWLPGSHSTCSWTKCFCSNCIGMGH